METTKAPSSKVGVKSGYDHIEATVILTAFNGPVRPFPAPHWAFKETEPSTDHNSVGEGERKVKYRIALGNAGR